MYVYVDTGDPNVLRQVVVPIIAWDTCKRLNINMQISLTENMLCAGYVDAKKDTCQGDSGGPLVCKHGERWYEYGVVSWGNGCGQSGNPGVYVDVVKFLPWIRERIWNETSSTDDDEPATTPAPLEYVRSSADVTRRRR